MDFPYSRGLSFYEVNDEGKITSARDIPEPTIKPGDSAIYVSCNSLVLWKALRTHFGEISMQ